MTNAAWYRQRRTWRGCGRWSTTTRPLQDRVGPYADGVRPWPRSPDWACRLCSSKREMLVELIAVSKSRYGSRADANRSWVLPSAPATRCAILRRAGALRLVVGFFCISRWRMKGQACRWNIRPRYSTSLCKLTTIKCGAVRAGAGNLPRIVKAHAGPSLVRSRTGQPFHFTIPAADEPSGDKASDRAMGGEREAGNAEAAHPDRDDRKYPFAVAITTNAPGTVPPGERRKRAQQLEAAGLTCCCSTHHTGMDGMEVLRGGGRTARGDQ